MAQRRGAIVIDQPNPWAQALAGVGDAASDFIKRREKKTTETTSNAQALKADIMSGRVQARQLASDAGRGLVKSLGLEGDPDIQQIINTGASELPPEVAYQAPVPGQAASLPSKTSPELGGYAVNMPGEAVPPSSKQVNDILKNEADVHALYLDQAKRKQDQIFRRQDIDYQLFANGASIPPLMVQIKNAQDYAKSIGLDPNKDLVYSVTQRYGKDILAYTMKDKTEAELLREANRQDKKNALFTAFETAASNLGGKRFIHVTALGQMLKAETIRPEDMALDKNDPSSAWYRQASEAILGKKDPKVRVIEAADQVERLVKQVNENITSFNRVIQSAGEAAGAEQDIINARRIQPIAFEDVSGGMTKKQFVESKNGPEKTAGKLISDVRGDYQGSGISTPRPSSSKAESGADKTMRAYNDIKKTVIGVTKDNPNVSGQDIKNVVLGNKEQVMAEYGLNEGQFSLLMAMADKVLA
jgi:hypothetical protein